MPPLLEVLTLAIRGPVIPGRFLLLAIVEQ
jgi:hypothetical protein